MSLRNSWLIQAITLTASIVAAGCTMELSLQERGLLGQLASIPELSARPCEPVTAPENDGYHYPGSACLRCHNGAEASLFTTAGTLYRSLQGVTPVPGAVIQIVDANGRWIEMRTAANGNFWTDEPIAWPILSAASGCPDVTPKPRLVKQGGAECNAGGCHDPGLPIHLP